MVLIIGKNERTSKMSNLITSSKGQKGNFGLVEKTHSSATGENRVLNFKLPVSLEFHERWTKTLEKLGTRYNGGGTAILLNTIEELLPQLEVMAKDIPESDAKGGAL